MAKYVVTYERDEAGWIAEENTAAFYQAAEAPLRELSAEEKAAIEEDAAGITDPQLREAAIRANVKHLERSRGTSGENEP